MLKVKKISKNFDGVHALSAVTIAANPGGITGIIGPNGSGKSTLINILTNMLPKNSGEIENLENFSRTFQDSRLWGHMTVLDTILISTESKNVFSSLFRNSKNKKFAAQIIQRVGLEHKIHTQARHLSYGQRKLLEIGRALATNSNILFFDEPFAGLFPETIRSVKELILEEKAKGRIIILIEHDMNIIKELCDYVFVLDNGKNIAEGKVEEVLNNSAVKEAYLGN